MKKGGFFVFTFLLSLFFISRVIAQDNTVKFLNLPFNLNVNLLQGWIYRGGSLGGTTHGSIDYKCLLGDKIFASESGVAMHGFQPRIGKPHTYGNFIFIKHDNGYATLYAHLDRVDEKIKAYPENQRYNINYSEWTSVKKGEYLGDCGKSGTDSTHLHFEVTAGKYATGRIDSYDLYTTDEYYPPNKSYTALGPKHLWETEPPQFKSVDNNAGPIQNKEENNDS